MKIKDEKMLKITMLVFCVFFVLFCISVLCMSLAKSTFFGGCVLFIISSILMVFSGFASKMYSSRIAEEDKEDKQKKQEKRPAHEVIVTEIKFWYEGKGSSENDYSLHITILTDVLTKMKIPSDKVSGVKKALFDVFRSNAKKAIHIKNINALRVCINCFEKEYPPKG